MQPLDSRLVGYAKVIAKRDSGRSKHKAGPSGRPAPLLLAILISHSGDLIHTVVTVPGFAVTSDAERVLAPED